MLKELSIKSFALIDSLEMELGEGLNVLTGETGAGKSIVLDAIGLLCGRRASQKWIRKGCDKAVVSGHFQLEPELLKEINDLDMLTLDEEDLFMEREISSNGANKCRINFRTVPQSIYQQIGTYLFDIHGQNQEQQILKPGKQMALLDQFLDEEGKTLKGETYTCYQNYIAARNERDQLLSSEDEKEEMLAFYTQCIEEIDKAELEVGEDDNLREERNRIANSEKLKSYGEQIHTLLQGDAGSINTLTEAVTLLREMSTIDSELEDIFNRSREASYELEAVASDFRHYYQMLDFDENTLNDIEERLSLISRLKKKYGNSIELILEKREEMQEVLLKVENKELILKEMEGKVSQAFADFESKGEVLSEKRRKAGALIESLIKEELDELGIYSDSFIVRYFEETEPAPWGKEHIEFYFNPNKGEGVAPLKDIASGGEISRIMLAFKAVFAHVDDMPSMVFDEIDTGIGGDSLVKVAKMLYEISKDRQVVCVTHAPIIAAFADHQFFLSKKETDERTYVEVSSLIGEIAREDEIARMLGGSQINSAKLQSKELLTFALENKKV